LLVERERDGKLLYFRFYDPRVLRRFLPTCDAEQLRQLFGPIDAFVMEGDDPHQCIEARLAHHALELTTHPLSTQETP
jgi:hypothetical protein